MACLGFLWLFLWEPVQAALQSCLGTAVGDCLTPLRDWAVAQVRNLTYFWGNQVELINTPTAHLVGWEEINGYLTRIGDCLKDDAVGIIGIYGMGGVGKTTLLHMVNNDFHKIGASGFDMVIWVTVSQDANILKIQKQIGDRLRLRLSADTAGSSSQADEQAKVIFKAFSDSKSRFLLLLDDVWAELDLEKVGIPCSTRQNNKCIIILTTRSEQVCINMGAKHHLVKVNELNASESWKLFKEKLGTDVNLDDPRINQFARDVAGKCGGLPLALITVGRAMATATMAGVWEEALRQLRERPHKLPGMKHKVLSLLKFSFDRLPETTRQCLLYCCLFPEDHRIDVERVIEYWVGEGLLDDAHSDGIVSARNRGQVEINNLTSACLLESGRADYFNAPGSYVKMHDVVREMCLWLTAGEFDKNNRFLVYAGSDCVPRSERWGEAKRISLMHNSSQALPHNIPSCPNLRTLIYVKCSSIPRGFFECMPALCVLDLSYCRGLESLPEEISVLGELRYLNLRNTGIESLPRGLGKLAKLSQLDLDYTAKLSHIPREAIPTLIGLRVLGMYGSGYDFFSSLNEYPDTSDDNMGEDTRSCWDRLEELRLSVRTLSSLEELLKFDRLRLSTTCLSIYLGGDTGITPAHFSGALERLEKVRSLFVTGVQAESEVHLDIGNRFGSNLELLDLQLLPKITVVVSSPCFFLRELRIMNCHGIRDLMWIRQLPRLQDIWVHSCGGMEELLPEVNGGGLEERGVDDEAVDCDRASLPALRKIYLWGLPALKSISGRPLRFPSLEYLVVRGCPQLKKLPLGPDSAENIREIWGDREWWESLEWHQDADGRSVKSRFLQYYVED